MSLQMLNSTTSRALLRQSQRNLSKVIIPANNNFSQQYRFQSSSSSKATSSITKISSPYHMPSENLKSRRTISPSSIMRTALRYTSSTSITSSSASSTSSSTNVSGSASPSSSTSTTTSNTNLQLASAVVVVTGENRTGIVAQLCSKVLNPHNASIGRTRMATLGSSFGLLARVMLPVKEIESLETNLKKEFPNFVTGVSVQHGVEAESDHTSAFSEETRSNNLSVDNPLSLRDKKRATLIGPDAPGLLSALTLKLSALNCNIVTLTSETQFAPHAGYEVFTADVVFVVPLTVSGDASRDVSHTLRLELAELGDKLGVEIGVEDVEG